MGQIGPPMWYNYLKVSSCRELIYSAPFIVLLGQTLISSVPKTKCFALLSMWSKLALPVQNDLAGCHNCCCDDVI